MRNKYSNGFDQPDYDFEKYVYGDYGTNAASNANAGNGASSGSDYSQKLRKNFRHRVGESANDNSRYVRGIIYTIGDLKYGFVVFIAAFVIFMITGIAEYSQAQAMKANCTATAKGEVVAVVRKSALSRKQGYIPKVKFTVDGRNFIIRGKRSSASYASFSVGDIYDVKYDPNDPTSYYLVRDGVRSHWTVWMSLCVLMLFPSIRSVKKAVKDGTLILK